MQLQILNNVLLKEGRFLLELAAPRAWVSCRPGQFLHVRIGGASDPFLRRPLSVHDVIFSGAGRRGIVRLLYEVVGKGTALLAEKNPGMHLDVLGPLGNGFDVAEVAGVAGVYIVAGGMGVAPLFFLAKKMAAKKPVVLLGARTKSQLLCEKELKKLGCEVRVATDDGSKGFKGKVTDLLRKVLVSTIDDRLSTIYACGPKPMLADIARIAGERSCPARVSLEEFMGCGLGACLGCVIRTVSGYKRICHDGPVFDAQEIVWDI